MQKYYKYIFVILVILINLGFILTYTYKRDIPIELINILSCENCDHPYFETKQIEISNLNDLWLISYEMRITKIEYCPFYIFTDSVEQLVDRELYDGKSMSNIFFYAHPYYIQYKSVPDKKFIYRLSSDYIDRGKIYPIKRIQIDNK